MEAPKRTRGRPRKPTPKGPGRVNYLETEIRKLTELRDSLISDVTGNDRSKAKPYLHQYIAAYGRILLDLRNALDLAVTAEEEERAAANETDPRDRTPAEVQADEERHAAELAPAHLQVYVARYMDIFNLRMVTADGTPVEPIRRVG